MTELCPTVKWFSKKMQSQLDANDHKGSCWDRGWSGMSQKWLLKRLKQEVKELEQEILYSGKNVVEEAADVANFAHMIADNFIKAKVREDEILRSPGCNLG